MAAIKKVTDTVGEAVARIETAMEFMDKKLDKIEKLVETNYVTKEEFEPIKKIVYGVVWLIVAAVLTAGLVLVLK